MSDAPKVALVCTPHPDDAEGGCGGTIAKWIKQGTRVVYLLTTNGEKGTANLEMDPKELVEIRKKEQMDAARILGVHEVIMLGHPDSELEDDKQFRGEVVHAIRLHKPDVVLTTDPFRRYGFQHRDHRVTGQVTLDAVYPFARDNLNFSEHFKEGLAPHNVNEVYLWGAEEPDTFIDITDVIDLKAQALAAHVSQMGDPARVNERVRNMSKRWGERIRVEYAEAFKRLQTRAMPPARNG